MLIHRSRIPGPFAAGAGGKRASLLTVLRGWVLTLLAVSAWCVTRGLAQDIASVGPMTTAEQSAAADTAKSVSLQGTTPPTSPYMVDSSDYESASYNIFDPGRGYRVAAVEKGDLWISGYVVWRYMNQLPAKQSYTDHLGREHTVDTRQDLQWHRIMVHFRGFAFTPKLNYCLTVWNVLSQGVMYIVGSISYKFDKRFNLSVGIDGLPGTRTLLGSHPLWLANDRVMADDFIRPGFSSGISAAGEILPGVFYKVVLNNNLSQINILASQLTRDVALGTSIWWQPTTGEFGPRGGLGDWEYHQELATRFGVSTAGMRHEDRYADMSNPIPGSAQIRLADSQLLFETGSLADGVTIQSAGFRILSFDAGFKYRGFFFQTEFHTRWLDNFLADGPLPVSSIVDRSFYVQTAFFPIPHTLEVYVSTSHVFGDRNVGFGHSYEYLCGLNYYPFDTRYFRLNGQAMYVNHSPASSVFGFYQGGQKGPVLSVAASLFF